MFLRLSHFPRRRVRLIFTPLSLFLEGEFVGNYTLSFWWNGKVQHGRIRSTTKDSDSTKYYLVDKTPFDTVQDLINYYRTHR